MSESSQIVSSLHKPAVPINFASRTFVERSLTLITSAVLFYLLFVSDLTKSAALGQLLANVIRQGSNGFLALQVHLIDGEAHETVAMATVNLWVMIEDSCNILLQVNQTI